MTGPLGTAHVVHGDARRLTMLADNTVDLVVTSPPYFALRSYQDAGQHYEGQLGSEATPAEFVTALLEVTAECVRVLKPSGSLWVNLGDKYAGVNIGTTSGHQNGTITASSYTRHIGQGRATSDGGVRPKSLIGIPWRYALACIDQLGLILRAEIIWSKPNGLPESVTDRVRRSHEQWFYFEQSGGIEPSPDVLPFCNLCGRPVDARATLVARLQELDGRSQSGGMPDHVREDGWREGADASGGHHDMAVGPLVPPVPSVGVVDAEHIEQPVELVEDGVVTAIDHDPQYGPSILGVTHEGDRALSVNESGEPSGVCECERHALTLNDQPWIPQSLAAELMQMVADGEADAQNVADFLSGDYARTHSTWFHFTLQPRYFSAVDEIREAYEPDSATRRLKYGANPKPQGRGVAPESRGGTPDGVMGFGNPDNVNPLGKLPGSVWTVPTEPLQVPPHLGIDHFAAYPTEWPRRIIQGWSPAGVCVECGEGRRPVVATERIGVTQRATEGTQGLGTKGLRSAGGYLDPGADTWKRTDATITGYACGCPTPDAPTRPAVVLDPFGGTGTTALVAKALGRHGITVDMSADYCRLAEWRVNDRDQLAKVLGIPRVGPPDTDQMTLFP